MNRESSRKERFAFLALIFSLILWPLSYAVPDAFAKPLDLPYAGGKTGPHRVKIEVSGPYQVILLVGRARGESVQDAVAEPLRVAVTRDGQRIGKSEKSSWWGADDVGFICWTFKANKGDVVDVSAEPTWTLAEYRKRPMRFVVRRFNYDYAEYFIEVYGLRLLSLLCALWGAITLARVRRSI